MPYNTLRHGLAIRLEEIGSVLTPASKHKRVIERTRPDGTVERGFLLKLHEKNPNAPLSLIFLNFRIPENGGPLTPEIVKLAARCMHELIAGLEFDAIVGVPRAGDPFAAALAELCNKPCFELDKWESGEQRKITGFKGTVLANIKKMLLVDDLITKADSKLEAIEVILGEGIAVVDVVVITDREQGGREELVSRGYSLHSIFTITELLGLYLDANKISDQLYVDIRTYLAAQS